MSKKICTLLILLLIGSTMTACTDANIHINFEDEESTHAQVHEHNDETEQEIVEDLTSEDERECDLPDDSFAIAMNPKRNYLIVVDEAHPYEFGGDYDRLLQEDLAIVADVVAGEPTLIEEGALYAFTELQYDLREKGIWIGLYSAYRTKEDQEWVYENYGTLEGWCEDNTVRKPGFSEHHTGLLLDIVVWLPDDNGKWCWTTETAEKSKEFAESKLLHETLADHGFIDRYPAGKGEITGVTYEPYEIRFVGSSKIAHEIMDNHLCLEEYLER